MKEEIKYISFLGLICFLIAICIAFILGMIVMSVTQSSPNLRYTQDLSRADTQNQRVTYHGKTYFIIRHDTQCKPNEPIFFNIDESRCLIK